MALLDGFEVISLKEKIEDVYLTITAKSLKFSRSNARALELPEHIRILFHEENRQIAIIPARETDENSVALPLWKASGNNRSRLKNLPS